MRSRGTWVGVAVVLAAAAAGYGARNYVKGASFVVHAANIQGWPQRLTAWQLSTVVATEERIASRHGVLRVNVYRPDRGSWRAAVLTPGVHAAGFGEPRLVGLAQDLAAHGLTVVSPDLPDLRAYQITPRTTDMIEDTAAWAAARPDLAPDGRIALIGISFGGGLSLVAAGRPSLDGHVAFAFSFGGHGDFPRVLHYLCTGTLPDGGHKPPHDYGVVIILYGAAHRLVPADQIEPLRHGIRIFLNASHLDMFDKPRARDEFQRARDYVTTLPEPASRLMRAVNERDVATLGPLLLPHLANYGGDPALSPERSRATSAPVYLLHGADDNVIPPIESTLLARYLAPHTIVHHLISPLITHAEVDREASVANVWNLIAFWGRLVGE